MKPAKLTPAMAKALQSFRDHGSLTHHLSGRSAWGGYTWTDAALRKAYLIDTHGRATVGGFEALAAYEAKQLAKRGKLPDNSPGTSDPK